MSDSETDLSPAILIVEDDATMRHLVADVLAPMEVPIEMAANGQVALDLLETREVAVVVTDLRMPGVDGMNVLHFATACNPLTRVIMVTGYATVESAVEALKNGAYDYIRKPFDNAELYHTVKRAMEHFELSWENMRLREENRSYQDDHGLIGRSQVMAGVERLIDAAAGFSCSVLITGESGSGKELVARHIHRQSVRRDHGFVVLNCAALPENIIESELFGHQKGAFTGADRTKPGLFEEADGGTLFLDEINNASMLLQAKLLRVLQDGTFYRLGDTKPRAVDVRVLAASNRHLPDLVEEGLFREDLYYRLRVVEIQVPPLRDRREDIPLLTNFLIVKMAKRLGKNVRGISTEVLSALMRYDWPGNVRELENLVQRMIILTQGDQINDRSLLPPEVSHPDVRPARALDYLVPKSLEEMEAYFIKKTLREADGNRGLAAEILGIDKSTLWRKIKRYELEK